MIAIRGFIKMKFSIIVPVYNVEQYLTQCVDSLLNQDHPDYEIILIDDGSPDRCGEICDKYAKTNKNIQVIHQKNAGVSAARNAGLQIAKGRYVTFVDPDDWVEQNYLSLLAAHMQPGCMAVCGLVYEYAGTKKETIQKQKSDIDTTIEMDQTEAQMSVIRFDGICGFCHSKMFDMEIIKEHGIWFDEKITQCEDHLFVMQYISHTSRPIKWTKQIAYHYRQHSKSAQYSNQQKKERFDPQIFSALDALRIEEKVIEPDPILFNAVKARQVGLIPNYLYILIKNKWCSLPYYQKFLKELRKGLWLYLQCDIGASKTQKNSFILCCVSPHIYYFSWEIYSYMVRKHLN